MCLIEELDLHPDFPLEDPYFLDTSSTLLMCAKDAIILRATKLTTWT